MQKHLKKRVRNGKSNMRESRQKRQYMNTHIESFHGLDKCLSRYEFESFKQAYEIVVLLTYRT